MKELLQIVHEARRTAKDDEANVQVRKGDPDPERVVGKDEKNNGSRGLFSIDPPTDDDIVENWDELTISENEAAIMEKLDADDPFFILGEAGWGKTSIIEKLAKSYGKTVITVYLDKAVKEDLDGIPMGQKEKGVAYQDKAVPAWAAHIINHPDEDFLLFFDEMNQADPGVMNALMPIVLKRELCGFQPGPRDSRGKRIKPNFTVGAAGNYEHENDAVSELSKPLEDRFAPIIIWKTGDEDSWRASFRFLHKKWDDKLGKNIVDEFESCSALFPNPRRLDLKIFQFYADVKEKARTKKIYTIEKITERISQLALQNLKRTDEDKLKKLAELLYNYVHDINAESNSRRRGKDADMIDDNTKAEITNAMENGYISVKEGTKNVHYGVSRENLSKIYCDPEVLSQPLNAEMIDRLVRKLEADGKKFKYETNKEFLKDGLPDPLAD
jgi:MoxR-like ATPase